MHPTVTYCRPNLPGNRSAQASTCEVPVSSGSAWRPSTASRVLEYCATHSHKGYSVELERQCCARFYIACYERRKSSLVSRTQRTNLIRALHASPEQSSCSRHPTEIEHHLAPAALPSCCEYVFLGNRAFNGLIWSHYCEYQLPTVARLPIRALLFQFLRLPQPQRGIARILYCRTRTTFYICRTHLLMLYPIHM